LPSPLPGDDLELMSDFLLSLETRDDLTSHVLEQTDPRGVMIAIGNNREIGNDSKYDFIQRALKLLSYWDDLEMKRSKLSPVATLADTQILPFKESLPDGKASSWKLVLNEEQMHEAQIDYDVLVKKKRHAMKYFKINPPRPMAWSPKNGDAWQTVDRARLGKGDLYDNPNFKPMYRSWDSASLKASWWEDPEATAEELKEQMESIELSLERSTQKLDRHKEREAKRIQMKESSADS
jgi:hypothetical protein